MTLNSLVLIPAGFTVTERAAVLGHSVQTNLMYYSFDPRDSEADKADRLNSFLEKSGSNAEKMGLVPAQKSFSFRKRKNRKPCKYKGLRIFPHHAEDGA